MIRKSTLVEMLILVTASVILLMALLSFNVNAQELASATSTTDTTVNASSHNATMKKQMYRHGPEGNQLSGNDNSLSGFNNNVTPTRAEILKQSGVPGKGIDNAPGLQKQFNSVSAFSNNVTPTRAEILKQSGVPGKGIDNAPGLQKQFNSTAAENAGIKEFLYRFHHRFQEMIQKHFPLS